MVSTSKATKSHLSLPEPTDIQPALTPATSTCARRAHRGAGREGASVSSPQLRQENLHHSHHVHVHVQREGGLGGSRGFNVVNLQENTSVRHSQSPGAGNVELPHCVGTTSTPTAPYHDATPAGAVEGVGAHWGSVLVLDVQGRVGTLWHVQQEVQHGVE